MEITSARSKKGESGGKWGKYITIQLSPLSQYSLFPFFDNSLYKIREREKGKVGKMEKVETLIFPLSHFPTWPHDVKQWYWYGTVEALKDEQADEVSL